MSSSGIRTMLRSRCSVADQELPLPDFPAANYQSTLPTKNRRRRANNARKDVHGF